MRAHEQRQQVIDLCIKLIKRGYLAGTGGNVALRVDAEHFVVTPSATDYLTMKAEDVCLVRLSDLAPVCAQRAPSVEMGLHARILRRRPDVICSIHTHQPVASAYTLLGEPLHVYKLAMRQSIGIKVPLIGYMPSGTPMLASMVGRSLRPDVNAYLMRNHGVLCCGTSIEGALQIVEDLEQLAKRRLCARIMQGKVANPSQAAALCRLLDVQQDA